MFEWEAGFVLIFDKGNCPDFAGFNPHFKKSRIVLPWRSTVPVVPVEQWRSALADILLDAYDPTVLMQIHTLLL